MSRRNQRPVLALVMAAQAAALVLAACTTANPPQAQPNPTFSTDVSGTPGMSPMPGMSRTSGMPMTPSQNSIDFSKGQIPKPDADGWILQISANLRREDGSVPPVDVIHLHHGVWLNASRPDSTALASSRARSAPT